MTNEYKSICDTCGGGNFSDTQKNCSRTVSKSERCGECGTIKSAESNPCTGKLRIIDTSDLASQFTPYLNDYSKRLEVKTSYGEVVRGYVGKTMGWKPVYILLARRNSSGSSVTLHKDDTIMRVISMTR